MNSSRDRLSRSIAGYVSANRASEYSCQKVMVTITCSEDSIAFDGGVTHFDS